MCRLKYAGAVALIGLIVLGCPPSENLVPVPSVAGMTQTAATAALTAAQLTAGQVTTQQSTTVALGLVISQAPSAGANVAPGSAVSFVISSGPPPTLDWSYIPDSDAIWGLTIDQTSDGGFIIGGGNTWYNMYALKLTADGEFDWDATPSRLTPDSNQSELWRNVARGARETADGGYIMLGRGHIWEDGLPESTFVLVKLDSNGDEVWAKSYAPINPYNPAQYCVGGTGMGLQVTDDGGYAVFGDAYAGVNLSVFLKTDAAGNSEFCHVIETDNDGDYEEVIYGGMQTAGGGYALIGYSNVTKPSALLIKIDDQGEWEWTGSYQDVAGNHCAEAYCMTQTADGGYVFGGELINNITKSGYGCWVARTNSEGDQAWMHSYSEGPLLLKYPQVVRETPDGDILIAGRNSPGYPTLTKLTAGGTVIWNFTTNAFAPKHINDMVLTDDGGCVIVASGQTGGPSVVAKINYVFEP